MIKKDYSQILLKIQEKIHNKQKIKVGFYILFDTIFPAKYIYEAMCKDTFFDTYLISIPKIETTTEETLSRLAFEYQKLVNEYPEARILNSYDKELQEFIDFSDEFDIICSANIHSHLTFEYYTHEYLLTKNVLLFHVMYSSPVFKWVYDVYTSDKVRNIWMFFTQDLLSLRAYQETALPLGYDNAIYLGNPRLDGLAKEKKREKKRKSIILTLDICSSSLQFKKILFPLYTEFFAALPSIYPNIDFIFRPHPLVQSLFMTMEWSKEIYNAYIQRITAYPNVQWIDRGDYFDMFVNSDGLIHSSFSFMLKYLLTQNPACFIMKALHKTFEGDYDLRLNALGEKCLELHYKADTKKDIIDFINNVVIKENDSMYEKRQSMLNDDIMLNYPHASETIVNHIKNKIANYTDETRSSKMILLKMQGYRFLSHITSGSIKKTMRAKYKKYLLKFINMHEDEKEICTLEIPENSENIILKKNFEQVPLEEVNTEAEIKVDTNIIINMEKPYQTFEYDVTKIIKNHEKYGFWESRKDALYNKLLSNSLPLYTYSAIEYLDSINFAEKIVFEYASSNSALWWSKRAKSIYTVRKKDFDMQDSTEDFFNVYPVVCSDEELYINQINQYEQYFDILIIDGHCNKEKCLTNAITKLHKNGIIIFNNSDRAQYIKDYSKAFDLLQNKYSNRFIQIDFKGMSPGKLYNITTTLFLPREYTYTFSSTYPSSAIIGDLLES